jgi:hypothetical protein
MRRALARGSLTALWMVLAIGVGPAGAQVQDPEAVLDHFFCYGANIQHTTAPPPVVLSDQFITGDTVQPSNVGLLCNPVEKTVNGHTTPIQHSEAHLVCYQLPEREFPNRLLRLENQFGEHLAELGGSNFSLLCVPSLKSELAPPTGDPPESVLSHFRCYPTNYLLRPGPTLVGLSDQFGTTEFEFPIQVEGDLDVCNPVTKTASGQTHPAINTFAHLA